MFEPPRAWRRRIRRETLSEDDLQSQLREKEVLAFDEVKLAMLEGGGRLSLIRSNDSSIRAYAVDLAADPPLDLLAPKCIRISAKTAWNISVVSRLVWVL